MTGRKREEAGTPGGPRKYVVYLALILATTFPIAGAQFNKKVATRMISKRYERKTLVVLKSGLDVSYCKTVGGWDYFNFNSIDTYTTPVTMPLNEVISGANVAVDEEVPLGWPHDFGEEWSRRQCAKSPRCQKSMKKEQENISARCQGQGKIPVQAGDEVLVDRVDVWARKGIPVVELRVGTMEPRLQERRGILRRVSSRTGGEANWIFVLDLAPATDISQAATTAVDPWLKSFDSQEEAFAFASGIKKTVSAQQSTSGTATTVTPEDKSKSPEAFSTITVMSVPEGAQIAVDQKFAGNTPSTLHIPDGDHTIAITSKGYQKWERSTTLRAGESITIRATLDQDESQTSK